ncbi:MAG TPA: ribosome silencing factor [bacterium]
MSPKSSKKAAPTQALDLAKKLAALLADKKGSRIVIFDLRTISPITDYFVIVDGLSVVHNRTLADHLISCEKPDHIEGMDSGSWVLLDYIDVVVHIFLAETRVFYGLERLWGDAPHIAIEDD